MRRMVETKRRERDEEKEKRKKVREARRKMDALTKKLGEWTLRHQSGNSETIT
jgi:hypothetical protein